MKKKVVASADLDAEAGEVKDDPTLPTKKKKVRRRRKRKCLK